MCVQSLKPSARSILADEFCFLNRHMMKTDASKIRRANMLIIHTLNLQHVTTGKTLYAKHLEYSAKPEMYSAKSFPIVTHGIPMAGKVGYVERHFTDTRQTLCRVQNQGARQIKQPKANRQKR